MILINLTKLEYRYLFGKSVSESVFSSWSEVSRWLNLLFSPLRRVLRWTGAKSLTTEEHSLSLGGQFSSRVRFPRDPANQLVTVLRRSEINFYYYFILCNSCLSYLSKIEQSLITFCFTLQNIC